MYANVFFKLHSVEKALFGKMQLPLATDLLMSQSSLALLY